MCLAVLQTCSDPPRSLLPAAPALSHSSSANKPFGRDLPPAPAPAQAATAEEEEGGPREPEKKAWAMEKGTAKARMDLGYGNRRPVVRIDLRHMESTYGSTV